MAGSRKFFSFEILFGGREIMDAKKNRGKQASVFLMICALFLLWASMTHAYTLTRIEFSDPQQWGSSPLAVIGGGYIQFGAIEVDTEYGLPSLGWESISSWDFTFVNTVDTAWVSTQTPSIEVDELIVYNYASMYMTSPADDVYVPHFINNGGPEAEMSILRLLLNVTYDQYGGIASGTVDDLFIFSDPESQGTFTGFDDSMLFFRWCHAEWDAGHISLNFDTTFAVDTSLWFDDPEPFQQPVPEPSTVILLGSGLVGLAGFRKRFKRA